MYVLFGISVALAFTCSLQLVASLYSSVLHILTQNFCQRVRFTSVIFRSLSVCSCTVLHCIVLWLMLLLLLVNPLSSQLCVYICLCVRVCRYSRACISSAPRWNILSNIRIQIYDSQQNLLLYADSCAPPFIRPYLALSHILFTPHFLDPVCIRYNNIYS